MGLVQIISIIGSAAILFVVIELIRRDHLKEQYSLIWLFASLVLLVFSLWRNLLHFIAEAVGIYYPPSFLFLLAIAFLILLLLHFSTIVSKLSERNKRLAQEVTVLKNRLKRLEDSLLSGGKSKDRELL